MDPLAYDLRQHEIFERPLKVDRTKAVRIPTPRDFRDEIKAPEIEVLPLVRSIDKKWAAGWCSYAYDFALHPDIELFCSGVNAKTPTAMGFWRQGNLLHFGFEQSPVDLNENGQKLLLNAIAYISRFSQDRPIARTRSVFAGPVAYSRGGPLRSARNPHYPLSFIEDAFTPSLWKELAPQGREKITQWLETNSQFLHPGTDLKLEIDPDLVNWGISFDSPKFFPTAFEALTKDGEGAQRARRLLERYVSSGPKDGAAESWRGWYQENGRFLFASPESNDYCWYVDPLAKRRVIDAAGARRICAVMMTCGHYDASGDFAFRVGLPGKSGVGGGILAVLPGQLGIGVYSPPLDDQGNSVRGIRVCLDLARDLARARGRRRRSGRRPGGGRGKARCRFASAVAHAPVPAASPTALRR
jgi:hypothetical protein